MKRIIRFLYIAAMICILTGCKKKADPVVTIEPTVTISPTQDTEYPSPSGEAQESVTGTPQNPMQGQTSGDGAVVVDDSLIDPDDDNAKITESPSENPDFDDEDLEESNDPTPTVKPTVEDILAAEGEEVSTVKAGWVSEDKKKSLIDQEGTIVSIRIENDEVSIQGVISMMASEITIPATIDGKPVTKIADFAFAGEEIKSVTIPDCVKSIGEKAFYGCENLQIISLPQSLQKIGYNCFGNCILLESIVLDDKNQYFVVDNGVLFNKDKTELIKYPAGHTSLSYSIPDTVVKVREGAFSLSRYLTTISIPVSVKSIGEEAFAGCTSADFTLPKKLAIIGEFAFSDCYALNRVEIPSRVGTIPDGAFSGCENLKKVLVKGTIKKIGFAAFSNCTSLTEVKFESSVDTIGELSFAFCTELKAFTVPARTTEILDMAFMSCTALTIIEIPDSVTYLGASVFEGAHQVIMIAPKDSAAALYASDHKLLCVE